MRDCVYIGSTPSDESCQQVGMPSYDAAIARRECRAFINQLRRVFGEEPDGAELRVKVERHDFGSYPEVVCYYDDENAEATEYAYKCEGDCPTNWDLPAIVELQPAASITNGYKLPSMTIGAVLDSK